MILSKSNSFENITYEVNSITKETEVLTYRFVQNKKKNIKITDFSEEASIDIIDFSDDVKNCMDEMSKLGRRYARQDKLYRHNQIENDDSNEGYSEYDIFGADEDALILPKLELKEEYAQLHLAIGKLPSEQCDLIKQIFFQNKKAVEIAAERGVSKAAISQKKERALPNLKKILIQTLTFEVFVS